MQILYVVELEVSSATNEDTRAIYARSREHLAMWLSDLADAPVDLATLSADGDLLISTGGPRSRRATWTTVGARQTWAVRLDVRDNITTEEPVFVTRVTVSTNGSRVKLRIAMGREMRTTGLSPVPQAILRRPGVLRLFVDDKSMILKVSRQIQDGRYEWIRTTQEVDLLLEVLNSTHRLPLLLTHLRTPSAFRAAEAAAAELIGLVKVVALDFPASRYLNELVPGMAPSYAGARLAWSDVRATALDLDDELRCPDKFHLRSRLMQLVAPVSVIARGSDTGYRQAQREQTDARLQAARQQADDAVRLGDTDAQIVALEAQLLALEQEKNEGWEAAAAYSEEADLFRTEAQRVPELEAQIAQMTLVVAHAGTRDDFEALQPVDPWMHIPSLQTGSEQSMQRLYLYLQEITDEKIVFTDRCTTSWKKANYPYPDEMKDALVKLARVAVSLYDGTERSLPYLATWIRNTFDLKVALQDDTIEKSARLRSFQYNGRSYNRTPHIKVRDHTAHQHVGRVHFAFDNEEKRIVVDHVGIKLY